MCGSDTTEAEALPVNRHQPDLRGKILRRSGRHAAPASLQVLGAAARRRISSGMIEKWLAW